MAVTVTATVKTKNSERISRYLAIFAADLSLAGTYVTGGFTYNLANQFRTLRDGPGTVIGAVDVIWVSISIADESTNARGYTMKYDYANDKIKIYTNPQATTELYNGADLDNAVYTFTKVRLVAIGNNA